jgi:hypothetical protein
MVEIAYPYLRPDGDAVVAGPWLATLDGEPCVIDNHQIEHFDYSASLRMERHVSVDFARAAEEIGIAPDSLQLLCIVTQGTGNQRIPRGQQVVARQVMNAEHPSASLEIAVHGHDVSRSLNLATELVLLSAGSTTGRLSPKHRGARLWKDSARISVDPAGMRFPMETVSFAEAFSEGHRDAQWFLDWSPQHLDQEFTSSVRLYLNEDRPEFVGAVQDEEEIVLRMLICSVAGQMIRSAITLDHFPPDPAISTPGSTGSVIEAWMNQAFPGQSVGSVRTLAENDPARFDLSIGSLFQGELDAG